MKPLLLLLSVGCSPDLPPGWEDATPVDSFSQTECTDGNAYKKTPAGLEVETSGSTMTLLYSNAHFRCQQEVEGFYLEDAGLLSVLVQPKNMDPKSVAMCDCLYDIEASVEGLENGAYTVEVWRRSDNINDPNDPELEATAKGEI